MSAVSVRRSPMPAWLVAHRRPIVWFVIVACVALDAFAIWVGFVVRQGAQPMAVQDPIAYLGGAVVTAGYATVFAILVGRLPENLVGWLFGAAALLAAGSNGAWAYVTLATESMPPLLPVPEFAALAGGVLLPTSLLVLMLLPLVFPDGRLVTPGWSRLVRVGAAVAILSTLAMVLGRGPRPFYALSSPLGLTGASCWSRCCSSCPLSGRWSCATGRRMSSAGSSSSGSSTHPASPRSPAPFSS